MGYWEPIKETKGMIEVSRDGRVRSWLRGTPHILKTQKDGKGYHRVRVTVEREKYSFKVHREVAKAFLDNPDNLPQVNHIDGNKDNNDVSNLEWVTNKENAHHAIATGLWNNVYEASLKENMRRRKAVVAYNISDPNDIRIFDSVADAERHFDSRHISDVLKGRRSQVKGFHFFYMKGGDANADVNHRTAER